MTLMRYKQSPPKYFQQMLSSFVVAIAVCLLFTTLIFYRISVFFLNEEITSHNTTILNYISATLEKDFSFLKSDVLTLMDNVSVDATDPISLRSAVKSLNAMVYATDFVEERFVYYKDMDSLINSDGFYSRELFLTHNLALTQAQSEIFTQILQEEQHNFTWFSFGDENQEFLYVLQSFPLYTTDSDGTIVFCIRQDDLRSLIQTAANQTSEMKDELYALSITSQKEGVLFLSNDLSLETQELFEISEYDSVIFSELTYTVTSSTRHLALQKTIMGVVVLVVIVVLLCFGVAYAFFASKRLYRPVQQVVQQLTDVPNTGLSSAIGDFEEITQKIEYITNFTKELQENLEEQQEFASDFETRKLLLGQLSESARTQIIARFVYPEFFVVSTYLYSSVPEKTKSLYHLGYDAVKEKLSFLLQEFSEVALLYSKNNNITTFILNFASKRVATDFFAEWQQFMTAFSNENLLNCSIGISDFFTQVDHIEEAYEQSLFTLKNTLIHKKIHVLHYANCSQQQEISFASMNDEKALVHNAVLGNVALVEKALGLIFYRNINEDATFNSVYRLYLRLISALEEVIRLSAMSEDVKEEYTNYLMELLNTNVFNTSVDYCSKLQIVYLEIAEYQQRKNMGVQAIDKILIYINENYHQDLSLDNLASEFDMSYKYISRYFKRETGENFNSYLSRLRIEKAKQILIKQPEEKVKDLAIKVGFLSTNTFIIAFKKQEGMTPKQYSELCVKKI